MRRKILVIDDDLASGQTMMWAMEAMGHDVRVVQDGYSGLYEIRQFVPDVVLCDIRMPGMNGYEVCKKMKADPRLTETLFIAQTALTSPRSKQQSAASGFAYHLVKPVDLNALLQLVYLEIEKREKHHGISSATKGGLKKSLTRVS